MDTDVTFLKYPRTPHLQGSRLQAGDEDMSAVPFRRIAGRYLVIEEKLDGGNVGVSFDGGGNLLLQSRGHYLRGGDHAHFDPLKTWAQVHQDALLDVLEDRYVMFGEWTYAVHTEFYDQLPHHFHEFDVYDRYQDVFLSTAARADLLKGLPVVSVPVLGRGFYDRFEDVTRHLGRSLYKSHSWRDACRAASEKAGVDPETALSWIDDSDLAEGLYLKIEDDRQVVERLKYVRSDFVQQIEDAKEHWTRRPLIVNQLRSGVDLYAIHSPERGCNRGHQR